MAATSLWHIEGRLKDLISYVENPEKTVPNKEMQDFFDVFSYVKNPEKTDNGEFVSAINCLKETALQQMILTKKQYQKTGGYIAWHGYQSFKPDEVTPEQCHEIGLKLAREMWGDKYQISLPPTLTGGISTTTSASTPFPIWMGANIITQNRSRNGQGKRQTACAESTDYR